MNRNDDDLGSPLDEDMDIRLQTADELDLNLEHESRIPKGICVTPANLSSKEEASTDGVLKIGTEFESDEHAHRFYNRYARLLGFSVRKDWVNRSKIHGQVVSRKFTCSREGYRRKDKRDINVKKHRKETRTGCLAHMIITRQPDGKYRVTHFEANHNHDNINPNNAQILQLQKELCVTQFSEADLMNDLESQSNTEYELMSRRSEVRDSLDFLAMDYDDILLSERARDMKKGEAGRLLRHFQRQHFENPSFFYAIQIDADDKVCNIFWADDNMVVDYDHFGDVVCLDTTHRTNKDSLPFVPFIGVNHHNQVVILAAAFLFDDTAESLKWLLHTFLEAMSGKKPKIILTDQDAAVVEAINSVLPEIDHRICLWQMYQNALKHLSLVLKDTQSFTSDFRSCIYDQKDEQGFIQSWAALLENYGLQQNDWLKWMFREREKWAVVYGRNGFFLDLKCRHLVESLSNNFNNYLSSDQGMLQFFKHFERVVDEQRYKEIKANEEMYRCMPRLMANVILLKHASEVYTPKAFEVFQREYEKCLNVVVNQSSQKGLLSEYEVNTFGQSREYRVTFNSSDNIVACNCMKFEYVGFLCSHALKVLDHRNIKVVPSQYILKRWTRDARIGSLGNNTDFIESGNVKLVVARRYKDLCCRILNISARAADSEDAFQFASRRLEEVIEGVEKILTLKADEAQGITSSSTGANASESENAEIFLDGNTTADQEVDDKAQGTREKEICSADRRKLKNINVRSSKTKRDQNVQVQSPNNLTCISSPPSAYVSPQPSTNNPVMQSLYNFEATQVVQCMYQQPDLLIDQQPNTDMYQQPNFYSDQDNPPGQTPLLQEPLIRNTYHESVSNNTHLRQVMDLDMHHPHSSSFMLYDHRYRTPDTSYLVPK
ncbi:protein FAR1-RELATED SEQUENCE 5-like [Pistacia vera]|uniref:protein FAR1-RELATED SEQUENCE 5-like n=1 Tax=Pistacia vera TaxID=55513 RepID=UPI001263881C|nr:protein FAR1-RELATED SEQUENCE 5-like [Pistacia vera]